MGTCSTGSRAGSAESYDLKSGKRYDIWQNAREYARETAEIKQPTLTATQRRLFTDMNNGDFSGVDSASVKTLTAVKARAEYEYDKAQRFIAKGDYGSDSDFVRDGHFDSASKSRQQSVRIRNAIDESLEKKGVSGSPREITSGTYKRERSRNTRQVNAMFKNR